MRQGTVIWGHLSGAPAGLSRGAAPVGRVAVSPYMCAAVNHIHISLVRWVKRAGGGTPVQDRPTVVYRAPRSRGAVASRGEGCRVSHALANNTLAHWHISRH